MYLLYKHLYVFNIDNKEKNDDMILHKKFNYSLNQEKVHTQSKYQH